MDMMKLIKNLKDTIERFCMLGVRSAENGFLQLLKRKQLASVLLLSLASQAYGSSELQSSSNIPTTWEDLNNLNRHFEEVSYDLVGIDGFHEQVDLFSGSLAVGNRDLFVPGNGGMDIAFERYYQQPKRIYSSVNQTGAIHGIMGYGWHLHFGHIGKPGGGGINPIQKQVPAGQEFTRCWQENTTAYNLGGVAITLQSGREESMYPAMDGDYMVTKGGWRGGCTATGLIFYSPEGHKYTFSTYKYILEADQARNQYFVSRIEDKHGNWINFEYHTTSEARLKQITTSDSRTFDFSYTAVSGVTKLNQISGEGRSVIYNYNARGNLESVDIGSEQIWEYGYTTVEGKDYGFGIDLLSSITTETGGIYTYGYYPGIAEYQGEAQPPKVRTRTVSGNLPSSVINYNHSGSVFVDFDTEIASRAGPVNLYTPEVTTYAVGQLYPSRGALEIHSDKCISTRFYDTSQGNWIAGQIADRTVFANADCTSPVETETFHYDFVQISAQKTRRDFYVYYVGLDGWVEDAAIWKAALRNKTLTRDGNSYTLENQAFTKYGTPSTIVEHSSIGTQRTIINTYLFPDYEYGNELLDVQTLKDQSGNTLSSLDYDYNSDYDIATITQNGVSNSFLYHADGSLQRITYVGSNRYDLLEEYYRGKPKKVTQPCPVANTCSIANGSTANTVISLREYFSDGKLKSYTDFKGQKTSYQYNSAGRLRLIDPLDTQWANTVISYSKVAVAGDNIEGSLVKADSLKQTVTKGSYRKVNYYDGLLRNVLASEGSSAQTSNIRYVNRRYNKDEKLEFISHAAYDSPGSTDGVETQYDDLGRQLLVKRTIDDSTISSFQYLSGYQVSQTDGENNTTTTTFLEYSQPSYSLPRLIDVPDTADTVISYNEYNQVTSITQSGVTETRLYDSNLNLCKIVRPETGKSAFAYNARNQLQWYAEGTSGSASECDASTVPVADKITLGYDNLNLLRSETFTDTSPDRTYGYDENGNLTSLQAGNVSHTYRYNSLNLLDDETLIVEGKRIAANASSVSVNYEYNSLGHLSHLTYPDGDRLALTPNVLGQATAVSRLARTGRDAYNYASAINWHSTGQIHTFNYGNGVNHETLLDTHKLPQSIKDTKGSSIPLEYSYTWDNVGNVKSIIDGQDPRYTISNMVYDGANRLKETTVPAGGLLGSVINYDLMGNIDDYASYNRTIDHHYDAATNRLSHVTGVAGKYGSIGYDARGNITHNGQYDFTWNRAGQMVSAKNNSNQYLYDGHNRRVKQTDASGTSYSLYSIDGTLLYRETPNGGVNYIYVGNKLIAKDGFIPQNAGKQHYRPFGESIEGEIDDVGYTGHKFDQDTGLSYMQARYYDPVIGRFYSNDPVDALTHMGTGNGIHGFNRYAYANNNPYKYVDPDGEAAQLAACGGGPVGCVVGVAALIYATYHGVTGTQEAFSKPRPAQNTDGRDEETDASETSDSDLTQEEMDEIYKECLQECIDEQVEDYQKWRRDDLDHQEMTEEARRRAEQHIKELQEQREREERCARLVGAC